MEDERQKERESKAKYAEELRNQMAKDSFSKKHRNKMTRTEKRMNYDDLQAFKAWDPNSYASIPGWGGNQKYYNQLVRMGKLKDINDINKRVFSKPSGGEGEREQ